MKVLVVGSGPSCKLVTEGLRSEFEQHMVVTVNHGVEVWPKCDIWFGHKSQDPEYYTPEQMKLIQKVPVRFCVGGTNEDNCIHFPLGGGSRYPSGDSGIAAILWAYENIGVRTVYTIGIDSTQQNEVMGKVRNAHPNGHGWKEVKHCGIEVLRLAQEGWVTHDMEAIK